MSVPWDQITTVFFDVDGTLYDQRKLRFMMARELAFHYLLRFMKIKDVHVIATYRKIREESAGMAEQPDIESWLVNKTAQRTRVDPAKVRAIVQKWIFVEPLKYMNKVRFDGVVEFVNALLHLGCRIFTYSDYPAADKLAALSLKNITPISTTDHDISSLKPNPLGLNKLLASRGFSPEKCLFIGDREDRDGECARKVGMRYLLKHPSENDDIYFSDYRDLVLNVSDAFA
jgi:HAD superfamily hydrolase (TIGR01549 family)